MARLRDLDVRCLDCNVRRGDLKNPRAGRWCRGLCAKCYSRNLNRGCLDLIALPRSRDGGRSGYDLNARCLDCDIERSERPCGWKRGLCLKCYTRHDHAGTLDDVGIPRRKIGDRFYSGKYVNVVTETGTWSEHRLVMEQILGRILAPGESVHHKNLQCDDNSPENLELWYSPQPCGARVSDLIEYLVEHHREAVSEALMIAAA